MRFHATRFLALLAAVMAAVADDVITIKLPESDAMGMPSQVKLIGTTGGLSTTVVFDCPATTSAPTSSAAATGTAALFDDDDCTNHSGGFTMTVGSAFLTADTTTLACKHTSHSSVMSKFMLRLSTVSETCSLGGTTTVSCVSPATLPA
ncbi:hypothetical protein BDV29DRAFT_157949 [Aspergillus leporis]|uniref:AA1-like domain-containing protein n=1 Tax=Aspergillus leporis TaxID=41062 RepID=A0A5N5WWV0_9EURO|nr:hypothetical protein BDV29DRAFT_157949 [Aspergillus leporis]